MRQASLRPALILFTDGDSTAGDIKPAEAVVLAQRMGVPIYTVQVGGDLFAAGRAPQAATDSEPGLQQIAAADRRARLPGGQPGGVTKRDTRHRPA